MKRLAGVGLWLAALAAPGVAWSQGALVADTAVDRATLLRAIPGRMLSRAADHTTRPEVRAVWRWSVGTGAPLLIWSACNGAGDTAVCVVGVGRVEGPRVRVMAVTSAGWSPPTLTTTQNPSQLLLHGSNGQCTWSRTLDLRSARAVRVGRARCGA